MDEHLDLRNHFPPTADEDWANLIREDLSWEPIEGIHIQPYYRQNSSLHSHLFDHRKWLIQADIDMCEAAAAQQAGAEALGFVLQSPTSLSDDLPVGELPLFFRGEGMTPELVQDLVALAAKKGHKPKHLFGAVVLSERYSPQITLLAAKGTSLWTHSIDLEVWHNQGATHVQELACGLAELSDLLNDLGSDRTTQHLFLRVPLGERILLDIARLRSLRLVATEVLRAYKIPSHKIQIVGVPSQRYESSLDPDTHLIRRTIQYIAAIIGGCNVITSSGIGVNLRMQQLLRHEGKLGYAADAAAGSWMIEYLTDALGRAAWKLFQRIESRGGLRNARSWIEKEIQEADVQRTRSVLSGDGIVVGANAYLSDWFEEENPKEKSMIAPLEEIRLRAKAIGSPIHIRFQGTSDLWLEHLFDLCGCTIDPEADKLLVTETSQGFVAQNHQNKQVVLRSGSPLDMAAESLFTLLELDAA